MPKSGIAHSIVSYYIAVFIIDYVLYEYMDTE